MDAVLKISGGFAFLATAFADRPMGGLDYPVVSAFSCCCHRRSPNLLVLRGEPMAGLQIL